MSSGVGSRANPGPVCSEHPPSRDVKILCHYQMFEMSKFGKPTQVTTMKIKELNREHLFCSPAHPRCAAQAGEEGGAGVRNPSAGLAAMSSNSEAPPGAAGLQLCAAPKELALHWACAVPTGLCLNIHLVTSSPASELNACSRGARLGGYYLAWCPEQSAAVTPGLPPPPGAWGSFTSTSVPAGDAVIPLLSTTRGFFRF